LTRTSPSRRSASRSTPGGAEVLDAVDHVSGIQIQAALDQHLLGERVAHLDRGTLGGLCVCHSVERLGGKNGDPTDAVAAGLGAEQDDGGGTASRATS
jgi:hypothetical protein